MLILDLDNYETENSLYTRLYGVVTYRAVHINSTKYVVIVINLRLFVIFQKKKNMNIIYRIYENKCSWNLEIFRPCPFILNSEFASPALKNIAFGELISCNLMVFAFSNLLFFHKYCYFLNTFSLLLQEAQVDLEKQVWHTKWLTLLGVKLFPLKTILNLNLWRILSTMTLALLICLCFQR